MKTVSSLEGVTCTHKRRDGNTTRAIDNAIQIIFSGNICKVEDPWMLGTHKDANKDMMGRLLRRLEFEHHNVDVVIDKFKLTIKLKD